MEFNRICRGLVSAMGLGVALTLPGMAQGDPTPEPTLVRENARSPYTITVLPNPVRGKKVTFRVQSDRPIKVILRVYDRFLDKVIDLEKEGDRLFDLLWPLKKVPEGPYYFQAQVIDTQSGTVTALPVQKFLILGPSSPAKRR